MSVTPGWWDEKYIEEREEFKKAQWEFRKKFIKDRFGIELRDDISYHYGKDMEMFSSPEYANKYYGMYDKGEKNASKS